MKLGTMRLTASILLMASVGCSGSGKSNNGGGGSGKLTSPAEKALSGQKAVFKAAQDFAQPGQPHLDFTSTTPASGDVATQEKVNAINDRMRNGTCKIMITLPPGPAPVGKSDANAKYAPMTMRTSGPSCPLQIDFSVTMAGISGAPPCSEINGKQVCKFVSNYKIVYQIIDPKLQSDLGLTNGSVNMAFNINQTMPAGGSGPGPNPAGFGMKMDNDSSFSLLAVDLDGFANLVSGTTVIKFDMGMEIPQGNPTPGQPFPIPGQDMSVVTKETIRYLQEATGISEALNAEVQGNQMGGHENYAINGTPVSAEVYKLERDKFANEMMSMQTQKNPDNERRSF